MAARVLGSLEEHRVRYDYLSGISREGWAWEHLRRDRRFCTMAYGVWESALSKIDCHENIQLLKLRGPQPDAEAWGLICFPHPDQTALKADVFWSPHLYPRRVEVRVGPRLEGEVDEIFEETVRVCRVKLLTDWAGGEHLRIQGQHCSIQVRCRGLPLVNSDPVKMTFEISGLTDFEEKVRIMRKTRKVYGDHMDGPPEFSGEALRMRNGLIALDARQAGLSLSETAEIIFGAKRVREEWGRDGRWMKDRVRGHIAQAKALMEGGYRNLLLRRP